jgi:multidrug efflux pump subunit AcrB
MRRLIAAAVHNSVAANLLMVVIIVVGGMSAYNLRRETFPQISFDIIQVQTIFPGATPEEVEESVVVKIEEAIKSVEGIQDILSHARESSGVVLARLKPGMDNRRVLEDIQSEVEKIDTFPEDAEPPRYEELAERRKVINIAIHGEQPERTLKEVATRVRDDLLAAEFISQVRLIGTRDYEISIEVSEESLRRHGLTFEEIRQVVQRSSLNLPGGSIKTPTQDIVVRTAGQRYTGLEFALLPLLTREDGTVVTLDEVARVSDGFVDAWRIGRFNGTPSVLVSVFRTNEEDALVISDTVRAYVAEQAPQLPEGLSMSVWADDSAVTKSRLELLSRNGLQGLFLVLLSLWLFMNLRLAFWVATGLAVALLGGLWILILYGGTLNMITMFAFIMALGMLVDDAIVVGENIYSHWRRGKPPVQAAIDGASEVAVPVIGAVSTTVAAFVPLFIMEGILGKFVAVMPVAVVAALLGSLLECMVILPPHLAHVLPEEGYQAPKRGIRRLTQRVRGGIDGTLDWFIERVYMPLLRRAMAWRLVVAASAVAILMLMVGLLLGGHLSFELFPDRDTDTIIARLTMPQGTPLARTAATTARLEAAARQLDDHFRPADLDADGVVRQIMTVVGINTDFEPEVGSHVGEVTVELLAAEARGISSVLLADKWRDLAGDVPDALELIFMSEDIFPVGKPIEVRLMGDDFTEMREAAARLEAELATYPGVLDISNDFRPGKMEIQLALKPAGRVLGITLADLAGQVNQGFYGAEALRLQRGRDDVKVMIRYPEAERRSLGDLDNIRIRTPNGNEVPFGEVATATLRRGFSVIKRTDRQRALSVTAEVDSTKANAEKILATLEADYLPRLLADYENMRYSFEGQHKETQRSVGSLFRGFISAMLLVYTILAVIFRSYAQPLVVMSVIPFGFIGAVIGHLIMGHVLSLISLFGLVALSGVLVNDSLVLVDFINRARSQGTPLFEAVLAGGRQRFRAIILTSVTTVAGLSPILFEKSVQAQFLIPMAISMSFGLMGATMLVLILVPALYLLLHDVQSVWRWLRTGSFAEKTHAPALVDTLP